MSVLTMSSLSSLLMACYGLSLNCLPEAPVLQTDNAPGRYGAFKSGG